MGPQKVSKESRGESGKSLESLRKVSGESPKSLWRVFLDCPPDFSRLSRGPMAGGPGRLSRDFFGISGPEGPETPVRGLFPSLLPI